MQQISFSNDLHQQGRLYRHLIASEEYVNRKEFDQYFKWAANLLDVRLKTTVESVDHDGTHFVFGMSNGSWGAGNLVIGVGQVPYVPEFARGVIGGAAAWRAVHRLEKDLPVGGRHLGVVGGGQSSGEVAYDRCPEEEGCRGG